MKTIYDKRWCQERTLDIDDEVELIVAHLKRVKEHSIKFGYQYIMEDNARLDFVKARISFLKNWLKRNRRNLNKAFILKYLSRLSYLERKQERIYKDIKFLDSYESNPYLPSRIVY